MWNGEKCYRKWFSVIQNGRWQPFCEKKRSCILIWNGENCDRKWFLIIQNGRWQPFCEKKKVTYWCEMSRNVIGHPKWPGCKLFGDIHSICPWANTPILVIWWVIVFTSENYKFSCLNWPRDLKNRSRSSIFELNQDTLEIHPWYKFGHNAINICSVIVFTSKMLTDRQTDRQTDRRTDGHANLIVGLVTRNPPNKNKLNKIKILTKP